MHWYDLWKNKTRGNMIAVRRWLVTGWRGRDEKLKTMYYNDIWIGIEEMAVFKVGLWCWIYKDSRIRRSEVLFAWARILKFWKNNGWSESSEWDLTGLWSFCLNIDQFCGRCPCVGTIWIWLAWRWGQRRSDGTLHTGIYR